MKAPKFSICIPTVGRFDLVKTALASLEKQTCQDFEVIIGDSHCNADIVRHVADRGDPRIRVVHPPPGSGAFSPWDYPPRFAKGKYVMWLDDDNCLLPFAFECFSDAIGRTNADIITGNHLYYYDETHEQPNMRHRIGIVPFTSGEYAVDLKETVRRLFAFERLSWKPGVPRFHYSATIVSRDVIECVYARLGHVLFPHLPHMYSLTPILFTHARTCYFIDRPVVVIGRLGVSMGQTWSTSAKKRFGGKPAPEGLSPLSAYTKVNGIYECYLRTTEALPERFEDIPIDIVQFARIHVEELSVLDTSIREMARDWFECLNFLKTLPEPERSYLRKRALRFAMRSPAVYLSRRLGLNKAKRLFMSARAGRHEDASALVAAWNREFSLPLPDRKRYETITDIATHAPELVRRVTGRDITWNSRKY